MNKKTLISILLVSSVFITGYKDVSAQTSQGHVTLSEALNPNLVPAFPHNGTNPDTPDTTLIIWGTLGAVIVVLAIVFLLARRKKQ